jgi:hypothetical protein
MSVQQNANTVNHRASVAPTRGWFQTMTEEIMRVASREMRRLRVGSGTSIGTVTNDWNNRYSERSRRSVVLLLLF